MFVAPQKTPFDADQLRNALISTHPSVFDGKPATDNRTCVAWSHVMLETGRGAGCWNWNLGNAKAGAADRADPGPTHKWTTIPPLVGVKGENPNQRAYDSLELGAVAYWYAMKTTWPRALKQFDTGDAANAAVALGESHYYTAPIGPYAQSMAKLADEYRKKWPFGASGIGRWIIAAGAAGAAAFVAWREKRKGRRG